jgi:putative oxidoreductase
MAVTPPCLCSWSKQVTDIFFSYKSDDRERVRPVRDLLVAQGFDVFWDQEVPAGVDWDIWIRQHLAQSKCALVFWSAAAVTSDNVRHEATVAKQQGKLIPVLLEPLRAEQFPMGFYTTQGANFAAWNGDLGHSEWRKLQHAIEAKLTLPPVQRQLEGREAERAQRGADARDEGWRAQIARAGTGQSQRHAARTPQWQTAGFLPPAGIGSLAPYALTLLRVIAGLLFLERGLIKLIGFPPDLSPGIVGWGSPLAIQLSIGGVIETVAGIMMIFGLFARIAAFVASGEMAVAYWQFHFPHGIYPAGNGGEAAILFCFVFFYLSFAGAGASGLDRHVLPSITVAMSPWALTLLRLIAGLLFLEHGLIKLVGFPSVPPGTIPFDLQAVLHWTIPGQLWVGAVIETVTGILVIAGLFARPAAFIASGEMAVAYWQFHFHNGIYPAGNGGEPAILFCFIFLFISFAGPGALSLEGDLGSGKK